MSVLLAIACEQPVSTGRTVAPSAIYGGVQESRWPAIGALIDARSSNSFCSAVLIDAQWVLTAGHCIQDQQPADLVFRVGDNADAPGDDFTVTGIVRHPGFLEGPYLHDVALLHIDGDTSALSPLPLRDTPMDGEEGTALRYVGYGYDEAGTNGIKQSADIRVSSIGTATFTSRWDDTTRTGVCFGDSGGAVLSDADDAAVLCGIISNIIAYNDDGTEDTDRCIGAYTAIRVDRYLPWIISVIGGAAPDCTTTPVCLCDDACGENGTCDNDRCATANCENGYDCLFDCDYDDGACISDCYASLLADEAALLYSFIDCGARYCADAAQGSVFECLNLHCHDPFHGCFHADDCDIRGGDCPLEEACTFGRFSLTFCEPSAGGGVGDTCDGSDTEAPQCEDGLGCAEDFDGFRCRALCLTDADCEEGESCSDVVVFPADSTEVHYCSSGEHAAVADNCNCNAAGSPSPLSLLFLLF